jgi:hypothetical protein
MMIETVGRALGFAKYNPGWDQEDDAPAVKAARDRVSKGLYLKVINQARAWRKDWVDENVVERPAVASIVEDVGEFVEGLD